MHYYPYRVVWANKQSSYWQKTLGSKRLTNGNLAWVKNSSYGSIKQMHIENTMADDAIKIFWKEILHEMMRLSKTAIEYYHSYVNSEICFTELCSKHSDLFEKALPLCYSADNAPFPLPDSELKGFDKKIQFVSGNIRELFLYYGVNMSSPQS